MGSRSFGWLTPLFSQQVYRTFPASFLRMTLE